MSNTAELNEVQHTQPAVSFVASATLPTEWGEFTISGFSEEGTGREHLALAIGDLSKPEPLLCRVHSECLTGDCLFSLRCDCGSQLRTAMQQIGKQGRGLILYLRQEGRGIGLLNKIKAYALQDSGSDTVEANEKLGFDPDSRDYQICKPMFGHFKIKNVRLLTNNPHKVEALKNMNIKISEVIPLHTGTNPHNESYLAAKIDKLGHLK
ncbi:MAG: GTP cyclohydrolase II [Pseudohongiellaceae bacterium]